MAVYGWNGKEENEIKCYDANDEHWMVAFALRSSRFLSLFVIVIVLSWPSPLSFTFSTVLVDFCFVLTLLLASSIFLFL